MRFEAELGQRRFANNHSRIVDRWFRAPTARAKGTALEHATISKQESVRAGKRGLQFGLADSVADIIDAQAKDVAIPERSEVGRVTGVMQLRASWPGARWTGFSIRLG